jgi:hypothetical protein
MHRLGALPALLFLLLCALAPVTAALSESTADRVVVVRFANSLPPGWEVQVRAGKPSYAVENGALHLKSRQDSYGLKRQVNLDLASYPYLNWRWKAVSLPRGGDGRRQATDDQAAQVYVVFPRWPYEVRTQLLGYTWENVCPRGCRYTSPAWNLTRYVVLRDRSDRLGEWKTERVNVYEDYKRLFGSEPPQVGGVVIYINSQHTASSAESYVADVYFSRN